jgi:GMP reductase
VVKLLDSKSLTYDDITLIAQKGNLKSRKDAPVEMKRIVVAGMTSIICKDFISAVAKLPQEFQPSIIIPRDQYFEDNLKYCRELELKNVFVAIGLNTPCNILLAKKLGYNNIVIDVAFGGLPQLLDLVPDLKSKGFNVTCGSIHTGDQVKYLSNLGCDIVRLGIGSSSSICSTRYVTGYYRGQISELLDCAPVANQNQKLIMADGGFKYIGDFVKAFLAGGSYCVSGKMFTTCIEARLQSDGTGEYFGMSNPNKGITNTGFDESFTVKVPTATETLESTVYKIWQGISSGISYSGFTTLSDAIGNGMFEILHNR